MTEHRVLMTIEKDNRRIRQLITKYKDGMKKRSSIVPLNNPVMFLIRKTKKIEFYEATNKNGLNNGKFIYTHSNGKDYTIELDDSYLLTGDYGNDTFKAYIHHEDWAFPMFSQPIVGIQAFQNAVNNAMSAELKWKAEEKKANAKMILAIATILAIVVGGYILYKLVIPHEAVKQVINQTIVNASSITVGKP